MISLGGNDWLGLGSTFSSVAQGTEECGSKPLCAFTSACKDKQNAYNECLQRTSAINSDNQTRMVGVQETESKNKTMRMIIIGVVCLVAIIILGRIFSRK